MIVSIFYENAAQREHVRASIALVATQDEDGNLIITDVKRVTFSESSSMPTVKIHLSSTHIMVSTFDRLDVLDG